MQPKAGDKPGRTLKKCGMQSQILKSLDKPYRLAQA